MEEKLALMMRVSRTIGAMLLLVAITAFIARGGFQHDGFDAYAGTMASIASVGVTCLIYAHYLRQLLRVHTGQDPRLY